ncbi:TetR/AcrR family transcriptional regulator [Nocardia sp. NPDC020380]|uniref:TetR/AcrR family transcriptional regulator n=1 Tax=Nocardia sp. NPDC020380 TaxID=3364309 RepID=UPI0037B7FDA3
MGNREDLLTGARRAILDRGLAKVTARDIANAAGVSLAAIGYHFGSKDRLVMEAITEGIGDAVGDGMEAAIVGAGEGRSPWEGMGPTWNGLIDVIQQNREALLLSTENSVQIARDPEAQQFMTTATLEAHRGITDAVHRAYPEMSEAQTDAVAKLYFILFQGFAVQWLIAPEAPLLDGDGLVTAIEALRGQ